MKKDDKVRELMKSAHHIDILDNIYKRIFLEVLKEKKVNKQNEEYSKLKDSFDQTREQAIKLVEEHIKGRSSMKKLNYWVKFFNSSEYKELEEIHREIFQLNQKIMQKFLDGVGVKLQST